MLACARIGGAPLGRVRGASARTRWRTASTTPKPGCWSRRTGDGGAARSCRSRPTPTARLRAVRASSTSWWCRAGDISEHPVDMVQGARSLVRRPSRTTWTASASRRPMDAEDILYILYTSGTTGRPKGVVHTTGGYLTQVYATTRTVLDLKEDDIYWCTADVGWGDRPQLRRVRAAGRRRHRDHVRGGPGLARPGPDLGDDRGPRRHRLLHGPHGDPGPSCSGARGGSRGTNSQACACWARWASPSTPRRGCGTIA